jgi:hypothetical protein
MSDADWQQMFNELCTLDVEATKQKRDSLLLSFATTNTERPNATWRQKLAATRKTFTAKRRYSAVIINSSLLRGVLRAMNWVFPPPPEESTEVFTTFEAAKQWAEARRGQSLPILEQLFERTKSIHP